VRVSIRVRPGAKRTVAAGSFDGALIVRVTAAAESGRATKAALAAVADVIGVRKNDVTLVTGMTSRTKIIDIPDHAAEAFDAALHSS